MSLVPLDPEYDKNTKELAEIFKETFWLFSQQHTIWDWVIFCS